MKVAIFTEMGFTGKIPRNHTNMRTEFAWAVVLDATFHPMADISNISESYDLGILIIPKNVTSYVNTNIVSEMKRFCKKTSFMQEGPSWYYQSLPLVEQLWFLDQMDAVDIVFAHNDIDRTYYHGLLNKAVYINPTLMIDDLIKDLPSVERANVIIGGNIGRWYGGIDSIRVAAAFDTDLYAPQMGRMHKLELQIEEIKHLPYTEWLGWMNQLNNFKYAVHLNPNSIGGTFNLNCAYLGIPCIGNKDSNTQRICFPKLSVDHRDLLKAIELVNRLKTDTEFYNDVSDEAKRNYEMYFSEQSYKDGWELIKRDAKL
jgi:hypothetical protein